MKIILFLLIFSSSTLFAAGIDCQKIEKGIQGKYFEYETMGDTHDRVLKSRIINEDTFAGFLFDQKGELAIETSQVVYEDVIERDICSRVVNPQDENTPTILHGGKRCILLINLYDFDTSEGCTQEGKNKITEYYEIIMKMDDNSTLWMGDINQKGGQVFFTFTQEDLSE